MINIALIIRKQRLMRELTQEYLADQLNISVRTYRSIETGRTSPTFRQLEALCNCFECSMIYLLHFNPETYRYAPPRQSQAPSRIE